MTAEGNQTSLSDVERAILESADLEREAAIDFLETIVNINSGTLNSDGIRQVARLFSSELDQIGFAHQWLDMSAVDRAGHLFAHHAGTSQRRILLIGHLDTVFERTSDFQTFTREGSTATGPGIVDMKGGDVVMLFALRALYRAGVLPAIRLTVALLGDEEDTGKPIAFSRQPLLDAADQCDVALGFEMSGPATNISTVARRGVTGWTLTIRSATGHSSQIFQKGQSWGAIYEAARVLTAFREQLSKLSEHLSIGTGVISGGTLLDFDGEFKASAEGKTNVIPAHAVVSGDVRFLTAKELSEAKQRMTEIVGQSPPGVQSTIQFEDSFPAMSPRPANYDLMNLYEQISRVLDDAPVTVHDPNRRGAADISFVAGRVEACLDGLGPAGGADHSPDEYIELNSLLLQTKKAALLIHRLTRG